MPKHAQLPTPVWLPLTSTELLSWGHAGHLHPSHQGHSTPRRLTSVALGDTLASRAEDPSGPRGTSFSHTQDIGYFSSQCITMSRHAWWQHCAKQPLHPQQPLCTRNSSRSASIPTMHCHPRHPTGHDTGAHSLMSYSAFTRGDEQRSWGQLLMTRAYIRCSPQEDRFQTTEDGLAVRMRLRTTEAIWKNWRPMCSGCYGGKKLRLHVHCHYLGGRDCLCMECAYTLQQAHRDSHGGPRKGRPFMQEEQDCQSFLTTCGVALAGLPPRSQWGTNVPSPITDRKHVFGCPLGHLHPNHPLHHGGNLPLWFPIQLLQWHLCPIQESSGSAICPSSWLACHGQEMKLQRPLKSCPTRSTKMGCLLRNS